MIAYFLDTRSSQSFVLVNGNFRGRLRGLRDCSWNKLCSIYTRNSDGHQVLFEVYIHQYHGKFHATKKKHIIQVKRIHDYNAARGPPYNPELYRSRFPQGAAGLT
jgi:hypothetical protein